MAMNLDNKEVEVSISSAITGILLTNCINMCSFGLSRGDI